MNIDTWTRLRLETGNVLVPCFTETCFSAHVTGVDCIDMYVYVFTIIIFSMAIEASIYNTQNTQSALDHSWQFTIFV